MPSRRLVLALSLLCGLSFPWVRALAQDPVAAFPDGKLPPVIAFLQKLGNTLTYLGNDGGTTGFLVESPDGKQQTMYLMPDGEHLIAGVLLGYRPDANSLANVTGQQVDAMEQRVKAARQTLDTINLLGVANPRPPAPAAKIVQTVPQPDSKAFQMAAQGAQPAVDKAAFLAKVPNVAWFSLGSEKLSDTGPVLYMVVDPQCPYCHQAWQKIVPYVEAGKLQVRIILIAGLAGSEPLAEAILSRRSPPDAWLKGEGSQDGAPIPPIEASADKKVIAQYVKINTDFAIDDLHAQHTPFLVLVDKAKTVTSSDGVPDDLPGFLGQP